eukprot:3324089-Pleurochrysis_carterae.AAC.1
MQLPHVARAYEPLLKLGVEGLLHADELAFAQRRQLHLEGVELAQAEHERVGVLGRQLAHGRDALAALRLGRHAERHVEGRQLARRQQAASRDGRAGFARGAGLVRLRESVQRTAREAARRRPR